MYCCLSKQAVQLLQIYIRTENKIVTNSLQCCLLVFVNTDRENIDDFSCDQ